MKFSAYKLDSGYRKHDLMISDSLIDKLDSLIVGSHLIGENAINFNVIQLQVPKKYVKIYTQLGDKEISFGIGNYEILSGDSKVTFLSNDERFILKLDEALDRLL